MLGKQRTMIKGIGTLSQWGADEASTEAKAIAATKSTTPRWIGLIPSPQKNLRLLGPAIELLTCPRQHSRAWYVAPGLDGYLGDLLSFT